MYFPYQPFMLRSFKQNILNCEFLLVKYLLALQPKIQKEKSYAAYYTP